MCVYSLLAEIRDLRPAQILLGESWAAGNASKLASLYCTDVLPNPL